MGAARGCADRYKSQDERTFAATELPQDVRILDSPPYLTDLRRFHVRMVRA